MYVCVYVWLDLGWGADEVEKKREDMFIYERKKEKVHILGISYRMDTETITQTKMKAKS